jgi:hypothetical protein
LGTAWPLTAATYPLTSSVTVRRPTHLGRRVLANKAQQLFHQSLARAEELASSDVDLMIIGEVGLAELTPALRRVEGRLGRAVNPTLYTREEFATKLQAGGTTS